MSWAYVFEWPIFAAYGVYVWKKLLSDERTASAHRPREVPEATSDHDPALDTYNEYLRRVHGDADGGDRPSSPQPD